MSLHVSFINVFYVYCYFCQGIDPVYRYCNNWKSTLFVSLSLLEGLGVTGDFSLM